MDVADRILPEFTELWNIRNFEYGIERFAGYLKSRRDELLALANE